MYCGSRLLSAFRGYAPADHLFRCYCDGG